MKTGKIVGIVVAVAAVALIGWGGYSAYASSHGSSNESLVFSLPSTPPTMNPLYANSNSSLMVADVLYEPLYTFNQNGSITYNGIAQDIKASNGYKTYTVTLKPNLKWSDGTALTANDVAFTFNAIMNPKNNALITQTFMIDNKPVTCKVINNNTIEFNLPTASLDFEANLSQLYTIPEHIYKDSKDLKTDPANQNPVGDGPYKFQSEEAGSTVTLVKNPNFYGTEAKVNEVVFKVIPNTSSGLAALESGQLSAGFLTNDLLSNQKITDNYNVTEFGSGLVNTIVFNFKNKALDNIKVRQAISYALNREDLTKAEYGDSKYVTPAYSTFSPETQYYTNNVTKYNYDLAKAKELMSQSGESNVTLRLAYAAGFTWAQNQAVLVQQELAQIGIKVELEPVALNAFFQEIFTPNSDKYDMAINGYNMGTTASGYSIAFTPNGGSNASNFNNPQINQLFKEAQATTDPKTREQLYTEIQQQLSQDIPVYTINYPDTILGISKKLDGVKEAQPAPISMFTNLGALYYKNN
ncbi:MAG: ABC transporter substrate-binding protein [Sarcina sp.]